MSFTIFYSWQSDLENKYNRGFILSTLSKSVKEISKDASYSIKPLIDRDTIGIPGSPSIVESITEKIAKSDVFICDVSIINPESERRKTPNPNVLFELGYASAILGWDRIILIQNTAYGDVSELPFDIRGRRVVTYKHDFSTKDNSVEKHNLQRSLTSFFKNALEYYSGDEIQKEKIVWWGNWQQVSRVNVKGGNLRISRVASDSFLFKLTIYYGVRSGFIEGKADIVSPHSAFAKVAFNNKYCTLTFKRRLEHGSWIIDLVTDGACYYFAGAGAYFDGIYKHKPEYVIDRGMLDEIDLNEIYRLMGTFTDRFFNNFQQIQSLENLDGDDYNIVAAGVKGLFTIMESVIITDEVGSVWCVFIDPEGDVIRYFYNNDTYRPKTIKKWIEKIGKRVIENSDNKADDFEYG